MITSWKISWTHHLQSGYSHRLPTPTPPLPPLPPIATLHPRPRPQTRLKSHPLLPRSVPPSQNHRCNRPLTLTVTVAVRGYVDLVVVADCWDGSFWGDWGRGLGRCFANFVETVLEGWMRSSACLFVRLMWIHYLPFLQTTQRAIRQRDVPSQHIQRRPHLPR